MSRNNQFYKKFIEKSLGAQVLEIGNVNQALADSLLLVNQEGAGTESVTEAPVAKRKSKNRK